MANNPLIPTPIVNKNGVQTTVHKKMLPTNSSAAALPTPGAAKTNHQKVDWKGASSDDAVALVKGRVATLSDSTHLWDNFEFFTSMLDSPHRLEAGAAIEKYEVLGSLRGAWLDMHGMVLDVDRDKYSKIKGPNGYDAFIKARDKFLSATSTSKSLHAKRPKEQNSDDDNGFTLNPFEAVRKRKLRADDESRQRVNVWDAVSRAMPFEDAENDGLVKSLNSKELKKAEEVLDILWDLKDEDAIKDFGRALHLDDDDHTVLYALNAHRDYLKENPGHLGVMGEMARYLKLKGTDYQQADGTIPHLEGYVDTLRADVLKYMKFIGEDKINENMAPHLERAYRHYNSQRAQRV